MIIHHIERYKTAISAHMNCSMYYNMFLPACGTDGGIC